MSDRSVLVEGVKPELLDDSARYTVVFLDGNGAPAQAMESPVALVNPYEFDLSRFLPNVEVFDLPAFFAKAAELIDYLQGLEGIPSNRRVKLIEEYPPDPIADLGPSGEIITFKVKERKPANMSTDGNSRPQRKATWSYDLQSKYEPNKVVVVESRPIDHKVEFSCWAKTNRQANQRALWLERAFITHAWAFEVKGAERFYWEGRGADTTLTSGQHRICQRPLNFFLRTREFEVKAHPALRTVDFEITIDR